MPTGVCQRRVKRLTKCKDVIMITKTTMLTGKILSKLLGCDNDNNAGEAEVLTGVCRHQIEFEQSGASSRFTGSHGIHGSSCASVLWPTWKTVCPSATTSGPSGGGRLRLGPPLLCHRRSPCMAPPAHMASHQLLPPLHLLQLLRHHPATCHKHFLYGSNF